MPPEGLPDAGRVERKSAEQDGPGAGRRLTVYFHGGGRRPPFPVRFREAAFTRFRLDAERFAETDQRQAPAGLRPEKTAAREQPAKTRKKDGRVRPFHRLHRAGEHGFPAPEDGRRLCGRHRWIRHVGFTLALLSQKACL